MSKRIKSHCNECGRETNHVVKAQYDNSGSSEYYEKVTISWNDKWRIIQCAGCENVSTRLDSWFSEDEERTITLYPASISRRKPQWLTSSTVELDSVVESLFHELYITLHADARYLSTMACRSIIDRIMEINLSDNKGSFQERLSRLVNEGIVAKKESELINVVIEAGNASTHRGWSPKKTQQLDILVGIIENLTERLFVLSEGQKNLLKEIPKRKKTKKTK